MIDKEVELREPLDMFKLTMEAGNEIIALGRNFILTDEQLDAIRNIAEAGAQFAEAIVRALPEGNEKIIALNGIKSSVLWAKHGITTRSLEVSSV